MFHLILIWGLPSHLNILKYIIFLADIMFNRVQRIGIRTISLLLLLLLLLFVCVCVCACVCVCVCVLFCKMHLCYDRNILNYHESIYDLSKKI